MFSKLNKILSFILLLALSINFLLYSSQSYSPPKAESISYSIVNCPSHENQHHASKIVQLITGTEDKSGPEKDCFCYDCCSQRAPSVITFSAVTVTLERYSTLIVTLNESIYAQDSYKNLPIRSPPASLA
jgi:hypothetical protein